MIVSKVKISEWQDHGNQTVNGCAHSFLYERRKDRKEEKGEEVNASNDELRANMTHTPLDQSLTHPAEYVS